ncbi:MAG: hypothetical protein M3Z16_00680 [Pseudomonadota bacterium]|nr:hypothetical protein [Pseudomonadota bacterium]
MTAPWLRPRLAVALVASSVLSSLVGCSPALDWRDVRPAGSNLSLLFPCRPERSERLVLIATQRLPMRLDACSAAGLGFSLAVLDVPADVKPQPLLDELRRRLSENVGGALQGPWPLRVGGTAASAASAWRIEGRLPNGRPVREDAAFFSRGSRLYQVAVVAGPEVAAASRSSAVETYFASIRVR